VFLNRPVGSYFFLSATRRSQFSPKEAVTRAGTSCRPRNCALQHCMRCLIWTVRRKPTEGKAPPHATGLIVSLSHYLVGKGMENDESWSPGYKKCWRISYAFSARDATRVIDTHFPLVQGRDRERGFALCLGDARPFIIGDSAAREFKEPR
jgi:hypothetical protein